jgi:hypothetical protein
MLRIFINSPPVVVGIEADVHYVAGSALNFETPVL